MKRLILCADDYALAPGVSRAIRQAFQEAGKERREVAAIEIIGAGEGGIGRDAMPRGEPLQPPRQAGNDAALHALASATGS